MASTSSEDGDRASVLVIDDDPRIGAVIQRALRAHDVLVATSGEVGWQALRAHHFDVVLCDLTMPDVSGMELYERVRSHEPQLAQRLIFMTGGAFTDDAQRFLDSLPNEFLPKPFDIAELRRIVARRLIVITGTMTRVPEDEDAEEPPRRGSG